MNFILGLYALLTTLYPTAYRANFREEMLDVFQEALAEAVSRGSTQVWCLLLRELRDLPGALMRSHVEVIMTGQNVEKPTPWRGVLVGVIPFFIGGLYLILGEIPHEWTALENSNLAQIVDTWRALSLWALLLVPPVVFAVAWIKSFPRWSYPFISLGTLMALYIMVASTPGLTFFGYPTFGREMWGWRALVPFALAALAALLILRSAAPLITFFRQMIEDWTLVTYSMFGILPLFVSIAFDEMDRLYSLYFMVFLTLVMLVFCVAYLRSRSQQSRVVALVFGVGLVLLITSVGTKLYWSERSWIALLPTIPGTMVLVLVFFSPGILRAIIRRLDRKESPVS
ncbi:MAG: hypothetical protein JXB38_11765 [Anaerolineales bacterium]|nr:hypothetical protein [Anaerolineales bacterium]